VVPTTKDLQLTDTQYRFAARLNLGLQPTEAALPATCPLCHHFNSIRNDAYHFMTCKKLSKGEVTVRHDEVESALHRSALIMGVQAVRQPAGLDTSSKLCPDLMMILPGRRILIDVAICHPLAPSRVKRGTSMRALRTAKEMEGVKRRKYLELQTRQQMELLPFVVETCGGMGPAAVKLLKAIADAAEERLALWSRKDVIRYVVGLVAVAVQRGGAMAYLEGYDKALTAVGCPSTDEEESSDVDEEVGDAGTRMA